MMKKWLLSIIVILSAPIIALLSACEPQIDIRAEVYLALEQMHNTSIQTIESDIAHIDRFLSEVEDKETKLEQLIAQTQPWVEQKKAADYSSLPCG